MNESDESEESNDEQNEEKPNEQKSDAPIKKARRLPRGSRYWTSWEEMLLIEMWRKHFDDVTDLEKNLPVFRTIANGLKNSGFHVDIQEVRRMIKIIKNKYFAEKSRLNDSEDKEAKSQWRLFTLVDLLFTPTPKKCDPFSEEKALKSVIQGLKTDPLYHILLSGLPVTSTLEKIENGENVHIPPPKHWDNSFPVENKEIAEHISNIYKNKYKRTFTLRPSRPCAKQSAAPAIKDTENQAPLVTNLNSTQNVLQNYNSGPLKRIATIDNIKQLRMENKKLAEECVIAAKLLKMEEQQFKSFEKTSGKIQADYEYLFKNFNVN